MVYCLICLLLIGQVYELWQTSNFKSPGDCCQVLQAACEDIRVQAGMEKVEARFACRGKQKYQLYFPVAPFSNPFFLVTFALELGLKAGSITARPGHAGGTT